MMQLQNLIDSKFFNLFFNLVLAFIIYYNAELGRLLGIHGPPLEVSVVWPSTGFALAALLLFGTKAWFGIFLGNFVYNYIHLCHPNTSIANFLTALTISGGSLLQALLGNYIIRKFSLKGYFNSVYDVLLFLIPGGILTCLVASTIGTTALYINEGTMPWNTTLFIWLTFWIGDTMGVYVFTPLLVIWSLHKANRSIFKHPIESSLILATFILISFMTLYIDFSLALLFLPLSIWITYNFGMHGTTLGIFLMTLIIIISVITSKYPSTPTSLMANPLLFLVLFLEITVATSLILAAVIKEKRLL